MKRIRYNRWHFILDLIGLLGAVATVYFYYKGHLFRDRQEFYALWANLATDLVSIWIAVRVIEYIIQRHQKSTVARIRSVKNMRFLLQKVRDEIEYPRRAGLDQFRKEFGWSRRMFTQHRKYFRLDEVRDVNAFHSQIDAIIPELSVLLEMRSGNVNGDTALFDMKQENLWVALSALDELRLRAEENILAETEEEWA